MRIFPNNEPEVDLSETDGFLDLWSRLKPNDHPFWRRVVLDYSAKIFDTDLAFYGMYPEDLMRNFERLSPNTFAELSIYYYGINLGEWTEIEIEDEIYYKYYDEQISKYRLQELVAMALCNEYNELYQYIEGFLKK